MARKDYIEKITQNLEHLTKDELKDVSILTTVQLGVRSKFTERQQLEKEIANLTPQLQQQAQPVVPECVAKWYEEEKDRLEFAVYDINTSIYRKSLNDRSTIEEWFATNDNKPIETIFKMRDGYIVEKPQLFYLKHIDMSKADKECDWYLITDCVKLCHEWVGKNLKPKDDDFKFTQQEIDSMQTGSYEQIEVIK